MSVPWGISELPPTMERRRAVAQNCIVFSPHRDNIPDNLKIVSAEPVWASSHIPCSHHLAMKLLVSQSISFSSLEALSLQFPLLYYTRCHLSIHFQFSKDSFEILHRLMSHLPSSLSLGFRPWEWAMVDIQPRWPTGGCSPSHYLTATLWETPNESHAAELNQTTEDWEIIINICTKVLSLEISWYTSMGNEQERSKTRI